MATILVRNIEDTLKEQLRIRAARHRRSMEAEARHILRDALAPEPEKPAKSFYDRIHDRFAALGGVELEIPARETARDPPDFL